MKWIGIRTKKQTQMENEITRFSDRKMDPTSMTCFLRTVTTSNLVQRSKTIAENNKIQCNSHVHYSAKSTNFYSGSENSYFLHPTPRTTHRDIHDKMAIRQKLRILYSAWKIRTFKHNLGNAGNYTFLYANKYTLEKYEFRWDP